MEPKPLGDDYSEGCELYHIHDEDWQKHKIYTGDFEDDDLVFSGKTIKALYLWLLKKLDVENPNNIDALGHIIRGILDEGFKPVIKYIDEDESVCPVTNQFKTVCSCDVCRSNRDD